MSVTASLIIAIPLCFVALAFFFVYRETLRIHEVVNSRLTAALNSIGKLENTITELRSTPASRQRAERK